MQHVLVADLPASAPSFVDLLARGGLSATEALCRRARLLEQEPAREDAQAAWLTPAERWLVRALQLDQGREQAPWARLAAMADGIAAEFAGSPALGAVTPAHLLLGRDSLSLTDPADLALQADEARQLFDAVSARFAEAGWALRYAAPLRWYVAHPSLAEVVTAGVARAQGRSVAAWMPAGPAARPWRQLFTEVQMTWQHHPVNEARLARGLRDVNTLWLHGCGALPAGWSSPLRLGDAGAAAAPRDDLLGAALRGFAAMAPAGTADVLQWIDARALLADHPVAGLRALDAALSAALQRALAAGAGVRLTIAGDRLWRSVEVGRGGWAFWRNTRLLELFAAV